MTKEDKTKLLGTAPVGRLFFRLALPAVLAQLVSLVNNVVDRAWVGHIPNDGTLSLGAVGVSFPIQFLFGSVIYLIAMGMAPTLSILLGKGRRDEAGKVSGACFGLGVLVNVVVFVLIGTLAEPLLTNFGAAGATLPFAKRYLLTINWGMPFANMLLLLMMWYNAQGYVVEGVTLSMINVVANAVLDPILIFACGMGVTGAAVATNLGAIVALAYGARRAIRDGRLVRFGCRDWLPRVAHWLPSVMLGLSTWINMTLEALSVMLVNASLQRYGGDVAVAAMALFAVLNFVLVSLDLGLSMGAQPIVSYNYGTGDVGRVRRVNRFFTASSFACSFALWALVMAFPHFVWGLFTSDRALVDYASAKSPLFFSMLLLTGVQYAHLYIVKFMGQVKISLFLGVLKRMMLLLPLIFVLPAVLPGDKATSVLAAGPITDAAAFLVTAACYFHVMRGISAKGAK